MEYLPLIILLMFISLLSVLIDRRRAHKLDAATQQKTPTAKPADTPTKPSGMLTRLTNQWSQLLGRKPPVSDDPVRIWLANVFVENPAERVWFASLTPEQFKLLRNELTAFCAELGFDLIWLVEQASFKPAALEATGKTIVTHYCRAVRAAVLVHDDMNALQRYQAFLSNPRSKENLALGQQLFTRLVDEKLVPAVTSELLMAGEKERQAFVLQSIQTAAKQNEVVFSAVLKTVVMGVSQSHTAGFDTTSPAMRNGASTASRVGT